MEVSNSNSKVEAQKIEVNLDSKASAKTDTTELENALNPKTEVTISKEGRELQAADDTKILKMPEQNDENKIYQSSSENKSDTSRQNDRSKINQIASKMMSGKKISPSEEKILKETDPQLYARAKAKANLLKNQ